METGKVTCASCGKEALYASERITLTIPVRVKLWFVNYSVDVKITVTPVAIYCPSCGLLKISLIQAKQA